MVGNRNVRRIKAMNAPLKAVSSAGSLEAAMHEIGRAARSAALIEGLAEADLPPAAISLVPTRERAAVGMMLAGLDGAIDVLVPRGGKSLVERVQTEARVPVFAHLEAVCHVYVDGAAKLATA